MSDLSLVYIENTAPFSDVDGFTFFGRKINQRKIGNRYFWDMELLNDRSGWPAYSLHTVSPDNIVNDRELPENRDMFFYYFFDDDNIIADNYVNKNTISAPLISTSSNPLGSGVRGRYTTNPESMITNIDQKYIKINCGDALFLYDREHIISLINASLRTNVLVDDLIENIREYDNEHQEDINYNLINIIKELVLQEEIGNLVNLWNMVFYRYSSNVTFLTINELTTILTNYLIKYFTDDNILDHKYGVPVAKLPINYILESRGFQGVISNDSYINKWDKGCISFDMIDTDIRYSTASYEVN